MRTLRLVAIVVLFVAGFALRPSTVRAAAPGDFELKLIYWPSTTTQTYGSSAVFGGPTGGWTTPVWGGDLRWTSDTRWGLHLKYDTGSEGSFTGAESRRTVGTDTMWSADLFYAWQLAAVTLRGFAGYGSLQQTDTFVVTPEVLTSTGLRYGVDATFAVPNTGWAFNAGVAISPSTSITYTGFGNNSSTGNIQDYTASIEYTWPRGWLVEGGMRWVNANFGTLPSYPGTPLVSQASGPFFALGYHW